MAQKLLCGQKCWECKLEEMIVEGKLPGGYCEAVFEENPELKVVPSVLYYLKIGNMYKIGVTTVTVKDRIKGLSSKARSFNNHAVPEIIDQHECTLLQAFTAEQNILKTYSERRLYTKWSTELFDSNVLADRKLSELINT
jgi:hypothetical protein